MKVIYIDDNNRLLLDKFLNKHPYQPATNAFEWKKIFNTTYNVRIFFIVILAKKIGGTWGDSDFSKF